MKSPGGGGGASGFPSGPELTAGQKAARDRGEAAKARGEAGKAREDARKDREDARHERKEAAAERAEAKRDRREGNLKGARTRRGYARRDLARARADVAQARRDQQRAGRDDARAARDDARARTAGLARPSLPDGWILGGNDRYLTCAAAAVANSLLLATGRRASDDDVLSLHVAAAAGGLDAPASVLGVLEAASSAGLAEYRAEPSHEIAARLPGSLGSDRDASVILELALPGGIHAVLLADGFAVTWGRAVPVTGSFLTRRAVAAWRITWPDDLSKGDV